MHRSDSYFRMMAKVEVAKAVAAMKRVRVAGATAVAVMATVVAGTGAAVGRGRATGAAAMVAGWAVALATVAGKKAHTCNRKCSEH